MTAPEILQGMAACGFVVMAKEGRLSVSPSSRLTPQIRDTLKQHKVELLELLLHGNPFAPGTPTDGSATQPDDETPLELLKRLRRQGVSLQLREVAHAGDETGEVEAEGTPLVWHFPDDWPDELKRETGEKLEQHTDAIAGRLEFEAWHWRACAGCFGEGGKRLDTASASMPYADYKQFARFQLGTQTEGDLRDLARFIQSARHECERRVFYSRVATVWRVIAALSDREPTLGDISRWAALVLEGEAA